MPNIEIKAKYPNSEKARAIAQRVATEYLGVDHQIDTYFKTKIGRLKLRESSLSGCMLIPYLRSDVAGPKKSSYALLPAKDGALTKNLFSELLGVEQVVEKTRDIYLIGNVRVHIDNVKDLGCFLEFEAVYEKDTPEVAELEKRKVDELLNVFEITPGDLLKGSYRELVSSKSGNVTTRTK